MAQLMKEIGGMMTKMASEYSISQMETFIKENLWRVSGLARGNTAT